MWAGLVVGDKWIFGVFLVFFSRNGWVGGEKGGVGGVCGEKAGDVCGNIGDEALGVVGSEV